MGKKINGSEWGKTGESLVAFTDFIQALIFIGSSINTVLAPLLGKIGSEKLPELLKKYADFFSLFSIQYIVNCVILVALFTKFLLVAIRGNIKKSKTVIDIMDFLHADYIHDMRTHIHKLAKAEKNISKMDLPKQVKEFEELYNNEYKSLQNVAQKCVNQVSDVLNECLGTSDDKKDTICTCIKMVSIHEKDKPISERSVITLARSRNSSSKRSRKIGKHIIGENSDFLDLSKGYRNYFFGVNLKDKFDKGEYNNSTPNFSYESTIVVPIRFSDMYSKVDVVPIAGKKKKLEINIKSDVDIAGYLCIDSEKVFHEWEKIENVEKIVKVLAFYADSLYIYLSTFQKTFTIEMEKRK